LVTHVTRIRPPGMLRKQRAGMVSRSGLIREPTMSNKQLPGARPLFIVHSNSHVQAMHVASHDRKLQRLIPAMVFRLALATLARFASDIACAVVDLVSAVLSWLLQEFLTGCAAYAEAMHPLPRVGDHPGSTHSQPAPEPELDHVSPPLATLRRRLVVVADAAQHEAAPRDLVTPRPFAMSGRPVLRDQTLLQQVEALRPGRALAARRKNRPR
jgi:hypothetical protein